MFIKSAVLACALAIASAAWNGPLAGGQPASSIPAGISLEACPNYPDCSNPNVAIEPNTPVKGYNQQYQQPQYNQPQYNQPQYQPPQQQYQPQYQPQQQPQYQPQQQPHYQPQYNQADQANEKALLNGEYTGDGDYRGEGLAESGAFGPVDNPQSYDQQPSHQGRAIQPSQGYHQAPVQQHQPAAQVPAGVDPHSCPNYPYCS